MAGILLACGGVLAYFATNPPEPARSSVGGGRPAVWVQSYADRAHLDLTLTGVVEDDGRVVALQATGDHGHLRIILRRRDGIWTAVKR